MFLDSQPSYNWIKQQSPCTLEFWNHWILRSDEVVSQPPFLNTSDPDAANHVQHQPLPLQHPQDIQHHSLGGAPVQTVQAVLSHFSLDPTMDSMILSEVLARLQRTTIPTRANGIVYNGFPLELSTNPGRPPGFIAPSSCKQLIIEFQ